MVAAVPHRQNCPESSHSVGMRGPQHSGLSHGSSLQWALFSFVLSAEVRGMLFGGALGGDECYKWSCRPCFIKPGTGSSKHLTRRPSSSRNPSLLVPVSWEMWRYRSLGVSVAMRACMRVPTAGFPDRLWNLGVGTVCFQQAPQKILIHNDVSEPRTLYSRSTPTSLGIRGGPWGESGPLALFVLWEPCWGLWELGRHETQSCCVVRMPPK